MTTIKEASRQMSEDRPHLIGLAVSEGYAEKCKHGFYNKYQKPKTSCFKTFITYLLGLLHKIR